MKKCLLLFLVGLLAVVLLTSCRKDPSETNWYKDWFNRDETTTLPVETTTEPKETTTEPVDITEPEETTSVPAETTLTPEETTLTPEETTTAPPETTTEPDWNWDYDYDYDPPAVTTTKPSETTATPEETTVPEETTAPEGPADPEAVFTITYVLNGGRLPDDAVDRFNGYSPVPLPTPTRAGYAFQGWYTVADFSGHAVDEIAFGTSCDQIFYAKWKSLEPEESMPGLWFPIIPLPSDSDK